MPGRLARVLIVCALLIGRRADGQARPAGLREDIQSSAVELRRLHPKLAFGETRARFDSAVAATLALPPWTPRHRLIVHWAEAIATIHDGHTQLRLADDPAIGFHRFPLRVYWFAEGLYVTAAPRGLERVLGARLAAVDGMPIAQVIARVRPVVHGDNDMTVRDVLPSRLMLAEVLETVGVTRSLTHATFSIETGGGDSVTLTASPVDTTIDWVRARDATPTPLYLAHPDEPYWYTYIDSLHAMYVQYNEVSTNAEHPFPAFCAALFAAVDSVGADNLILDIRFNNGGDNTLLRPLVLGLIRSRRVDRPGHLFTVIGRLTFSAAVNLAAELERYTETTFVGEPTAAPANHYGETQRVRLPRTNILLLHSTLYWQGADPRDTRPWIAPTLAAPPTAATYFAGRDPALEAITQAIHAAP